tara:strand:+ start:645 stop:899 length:255 start_codon:yes stop_codon:yes gene_type:complete
MAKYKPISESKVDRFISAIFRALGSATRPFFIASLIKRDKNFAKLWKQGEENRKNIDAYLKKVTKGTKLTRKQQDAFDKGKFPF